MMLKKDLIHQIMKSTDHCLKEKIKNWTMKDELGRTIKAESAAVDQKRILT